MRIDFFGKSDKGKTRRANEDYYFSEKIDEDEHLFIVADGMGGHRAGDVASKLGTLSFVGHYKNFRKSKGSVVDSMILSLKRANDDILQQAADDPEKRGMGTTFSACAFSPTKVTIIHVGDSRVYLVRNNKIRRMTTDQTFVEKLVEEGRLSEEEARDHPQKNILYMSLGARETFYPELIEDFELQEGDIFVLCSDGLNNLVTDELIKYYAEAYAPKTAVEELISCANDNGGTDNITIQVISIGRVQRPRKPAPPPVVKQRRRFLFFGFF